MTPSPRLERFGAANPGTQSSTAHAIGETAFVCTRSVRPFTVAAFDLRSNRVTDRHELPIEDGPWPVTGVGSHAITSYDGDPYVGVYGPGDLYRLSDDGLSRVASVPDTWFVWDLDATAEGTIYGGTYPGSGVFAYDVETGELADLGAAHPDEDYARAVAADAATCYVGAGGERARLVAIDRASGDREDVLPAALRDRSMVDGIVLTDDRVVASARGRDRETTAALVAVDRTDPDRHRIVETDDLVRFYGLTRHDGGVYVAARELRPSGTDTVLYRYDLEGGTFEKVFTAPTEVGCSALTTVDDRLVAADDYGAVWTYDVASGDHETTDLAAAGLPPREELPQSLTVHDGTPIVAGHRKLHVHDLEDGTVETARIPGEGKAMASVGERVFAAVYKHAFFVEFDPADPDPTVVGTVDHEQTRPRTLHHHEATGLVLMGTVPDSGKIGGAVAAYDPSADALTVDRGVVPGQSIRRIASIGETAYLASERRGGGGSDPGKTEARLVAWDPIEREIRWECVPVPGAHAIVDVASVGGVLRGVTAGGDRFVVDPAERDAVAVDPLPLESGESVGALAVVDGRVYGVTDRRLYRIDPDTGALETVLDGLESKWYNEPMVADDDRGRLYLVDDFRLVRVDVS